MNQTGEHSPTKKVSINTNSNYISYTSPFQKNKKGHPKQVTKGIGKFKDEGGNINNKQIEKYVFEIETLLSNIDTYTANYESYLEAKEKFSEFAIECVFKGSEFENKYNQDSTRRSMEKYIPLYDIKGNYILPAILFSGVSAGGKTTTLKHAIGSADTEFPATMQANTTVGNFHAVNIQNSKFISGVSRFTTLASIEERLKFAIIEISKIILTKNTILQVEQADLINSVFEALTIFDDRKCKLKYIISKDDIIQYNIVDLSYAASLEIWKGFLTKYRKLGVGIEIHDEFNKNTSSEFFVEFGDYISDILQEGHHKSSVNNLLATIMKMINIKVTNILSTLISTINQQCEIDSSLQFEVHIADDKKSHTITSKTKFDILAEVIGFPKIFSLKMSYDADKKPDQALRKSFFKTMEHISSASENLIGKTLFPIVEEIRIQGNWKPLWFDENDHIEDHTIVDSEGLGHDMSSSGISIELRNVMSQCKRIAFIQNGSEAIGDNFSEALGLLISTGSIYKTTFCFNRLENFDSKSSSNIENRIAFIKSGISNAIKNLTTIEENTSEKIVTGKEYLYESLVNSNSRYFEHLDTIFDSRSKFVPSKNFEQYNNMTKMIQNSDDSSKSVLSGALDLFYEQFTDEFNSVNNIESLLSELNVQQNLSLDEIASLNFKPDFSSLKFVKLYMKLNEEFTTNFLDKVDNQVWQAVKAFNSRIAYNYDHREWRNLRPESDFIGYAQKKIISYLLNPENIDDEKMITDKSLYVKTVSNLMDTQLSNEFKLLAEKIIYNALHSGCWQPGIELSGPGSTKTRKVLFHTQLNEKLISDIESDATFRKFKSIVFENKVMDCISYKYI